MPFKRAPGCSCCGIGRCGVRCEHAKDGYTANIVYITTPYWDPDDTYENDYLNHMDFFLLAEGYNDTEDACVFRRDTQRFDDKLGGPVDLSLVLYVLDGELRLEITRDGEKFCWSLTATDPLDMSYHTSHTLEPEVGTDCLEPNLRSITEGYSHTIGVGFICRECLFSLIGWPDYQYAPPTIPVTMSGWTNDQGQECSELNGTFLTQFSSVNYCGWRGIWAYDWGYIAIHIQATDYWIESFPAEWIVGLTIAEYIPTDDSYDRHRFQYRKSYDPDVYVPDLDGHETVPFRYDSGSPGDLCNYPPSIELN